MINTNDQVSGPQTAVENMKEPEQQDNTIINRKTSVEAQGKRNLLHNDRLSELLRKMNI
jgi:hypothetical protein